MTSARDEHRGLLPGHLELRGRLGALRERAGVDLDPAGVVLAHPAELDVVLRAVVDPARRAPAEHVALDPPGDAGARLLVRRLGRRRRHARTAPAPTRRPPAARATTPTGRCAASAAPAARPCSASRRRPPTAAAGARAPASRTSPRARPRRPPTRPTGNGSGSVEDERCVRLSSPRVSSDDVPSGKTSHSLADTRRHRRGRRQPQPQPRVPEQLGAVGRPLPGQRRRVVVALVGRLPPRQRAGAAVPRRGADVRRARRTPTSPSPSAALLLAGTRQRPLPARSATRPRPCRRSAPGRVERLLEPGQRRLVVVPVVDAAQPAVPPAGHHRHQVDVRPGQRGGRRHVAPRPEQQPVRRAVLAQRLHGAERVVAVAVGPAADQHRRALDPVVRRPHRAVPPVRRVALLLQPAQQPRLAARRPGAASRRATRRRPARAPAAARSSPPCTPGSRPGRAAAATPPM